MYLKNSDMSLELFYAKEAKYSISLSILVEKLHHRYVIDWVLNTLLTSISLLTYQAPKRLTY